MTISLIRTFLLYLVVVFSLRIMGKRQIGEMQASELVVTIMISNLAALPMSEIGVPLAYGIVPILSLVFIEVILSFIMLKSPKFRKAITGSPVVVINDGVIIQKAMKDIRFTNEDLMEELRKGNIFDISLVQYAIVETDGKLSFFLRPEEQPMTPKIAGVTPENSGSGIPVVVISDGIVSEYSLRLCGKNKAWIDKTLKKEKLGLKDVYLLTCDKTGNYYLVRKETA